MTEKVGGMQVDIVASGGLGVLTLLICAIVFGPSWLGLGSALGAIGLVVAILVIAGIDGKSQRGN